MKPSPLACLFIIFPIVMGGYISFELWKRPENYHKRIQAFYGENSSITQWMLSPYVILISRAIALLLFVLPLFFLVLLLVIAFFE